MALPDHSITVKYGNFRRKVAPRLVIQTVEKSKAIRGGGAFIELKAVVVWVLALWQTGKLLEDSVLSGGGSETGR